MSVINERLSVRIAFEGVAAAKTTPPTTTTTSTTNIERDDVKGNGRSLTTTNVVSTTVSLYSIVFHSRVARLVIEMGGKEEQQYFPPEVSSLLTALSGGDNLAAGLLEDAMVSGRAVDSIPKLSTADRSHNIVDANTGGSEVTFVAGRWETLLCTSSATKTDYSISPENTKNTTTSATTSQPLLTVVPGPFPSYDPQSAASDLCEYLSRFEVAWLQFTINVAEAQAARKHALMAYIGEIEKAGNNNNISTENNNNTESSSGITTHPSFQFRWLGRSVPRLNDDTTNNNNNNASSTATPPGVFPDPLFVDPVDAQRITTSTTTATTPSSLAVSNIDLDFKMPFRAAGRAITTYIPRPLPPSQRLANIILPWEKSFLDTLYCPDDVATGTPPPGDTTTTLGTPPPRMTRLLQLVHVASFLQADYLKTLLLAKLAEILLLHGSGSGIP